MIDTSIDTTKRISGRWVGYGLLLIAIATFATGCGVTEPSQESWSSVASFAWPADTTAQMRYRVDHFPYGKAVPSDFSEVSARRSTETYNGVPMYELRNEASGSRFWLRYLVVHDTLITRNEKFPADYALVAPLEKGRSWICGHTLDTIAWRATVVERYSYRKVEGRVYKNVIEVEYRPEVSPIRESWVRYYAEGIGPVQTIKNFDADPNASESSLLPTVEQTVLISSNVAPN